jgi:hypothetical protein
MRRIQFFLVTFLAIVLTGCNFPLLNSLQPQDSVISTEKMALTLTAMRAVTITPTVQAPGQCGYNWASQYLPNESEKLQNALSAAGVRFTSARAKAFGETCTDSVTLKIVGFSTMETDFEIALPISDLNNTAEMGDTASLVLQTIFSFPVDAFPGSNPGYVGLTFQSPDGDQNLWFQISLVKNSVLGGMKGSDLYNLLLNH